TSPLSRGINTHFRPEVLSAGGMVQGIYRSEHKLHIPLWIDGAQCFPGNFMPILYVNVVIHYDHDLREHRLPQGPNGVHNLAGMPGIRLANCHDHQIVEDALSRHGNIDDLRILHLHDWQEDALDSMAHKEILLRRRSHDGREVKRLAPLRHAGNVKNRIPSLERIEPGVVPKGPFDA